MLTPRLSLSSRSSSPAPISPIDPSSQNPTVPKIIQRSIDLLDVSLSHYLPGNVDPDDASVKKACADEDVQLDHVLTPLVVLMTKLCKHNVECRKAVRQKILPPDLCVSFSFFSCCEQHDEWVVLTGDGLMSVGIVRRRWNRDQIRSGGVYDLWPAYTTNSSKTLSEN